jgi:tetratricopeptide (TPR) repeat protein
MIRSWKILLLLACIVLIVYGNALPNGFISDDLAIPKNLPGTTLASIIASPHIITRSLLYFFIYKIAGLSPAAFRISNVFIHIVNVWLVYGLLTLLTKRNIAAIAALLFAIHPIMVESVTWISGGVSPQYTLFILLTLYCYIAAAKQNEKSLYILSLFFGLLSLVSADKAIILPLILALYEISFGNILRFWKRLLPFFLVAFGFIALYWSWIGTRLTGLQTTFYQSATAVRNPLLYIPEALAQYMELFVWPVNLSLYHPDQQLTMATLITNSAIALAYLCITIIAFFRWRALFFFLTFFLLSISPTLLPIQVTWTVAERYAYLGMVGLTGAAAYLFTQLKLPHRAIYVSVALIVLLLSTRTILRNRDWHDEISFWSATAKTAPNLPNVHSNLAVALGQKGDYQGAIKEFQTTIALKPDWVDPYYNLSLTYQRAGKLSDAISWYQKTLQLNPTLWQPYRNLAEIAFGEKKYDEAIAYLQKAIDNNPTNANLFVNLAIVYRAKGDKKGAESAINRAQTIDPTNSAAN